MITRATVRAAAVTALNRYLPDHPVLVGQRWPVVTPQLGTALLLRTGDESMQAITRMSSPGYAISMPLHVHARAAVSPNPFVPPGTSAHGAALEAAIDHWAEALREALLGDPDFSAFVGDGAARVEIRVNDEGDELLADIAFTVECQWEVTFPPRVPDDLGRVHVRLDAIEPFDATGTYSAEAPFPPASAPPREAGPDGRAEAGFDVTLPNT